MEGKGRGERGQSGWENEGRELRTGPPIG